MSAHALLECSFLIPVRQDSVLSAGRKHEPWLWDWLEGELHDRFEGFTYAPGTYRGSYTDPDTHSQVADESVKYTVAVREMKLDELRDFLAIACLLFRQKCIYLSVAGHVEFIGPLEHDAD